MVCDADLEDIPIPEKPDLEYISKYQKLIGELMFLCVNTCPEISYALSVFSRYFHSKQDNFIRLPIRVGMIFYLLENRPTLMTSFAIMQLSRGKLSFPKLLSRLQQRQN